jgi:ribosome maturation factor RimP
VGLRSHFFFGDEGNLARLADELLGRLERLATSEGVELVAVEMGGTAHKAIVRLVLDRADGAISLADCELVSRQASVLFDAYDALQGPFTLEVSSPGLERKLYNDKDFTRFSGRAVRVRMRPSWPPPRVIAGVLEGRADGFVKVRDAAGVVAELPEAEVSETRLAPQPEEPAQRPRRRGRK